MRNPAFALLALLSFPGIAIAADRAGQQAVFIDGFKKEPGWSHPLEHSVPAETWRGKRVRLTLNLKNEQDAKAEIALLIAKPNGVILSAPWQQNPRGSDAWQTHQFVMDVPGDATALAIRINLGGKGLAQVDDIKFEAVGADVHVGGARRDSLQPTLFNRVALDGSFGNY